MEPPRRAFDWRDWATVLGLVAILAFLNLWFTTHHVSPWAYGIGNAIVAGALVVRQLFAENVNDMSRALSSWMASKAVHKGVAIGVVAVLVFTNTCSSIRVEDADAKPVTIYRVASVSGPERSPNAVVPVLDSIRLDTFRRSATLWVVTVPWGRQFALYSSRHGHIRELEVVGWRETAIQHPKHFSDAAALVAALSMPRLFDAIGPGRPLRISLEPRTAGEPLGADTLGYPNGVLFSFSEPAARNDSTRIRWLSLLHLHHPSDDTAKEARVVADWLKTRWVKTKAPLVPGVELKLIVRSADGRVLAEQPFTLNDNTSDVILPSRH